MLILLFFDASVLSLTSLPPKPNDTLDGLARYLGALGIEKVMPCGCVCAFAKKSESSSAWFAAAWSSGLELVLCVDAIKILPSKEALATMLGL